MKSIKLLRVYYGPFVQAQWARIQAERSCMAKISEEKGIFLDEKIIQLNKNKFHDDEKYLKDGVEVEVLNVGNFLSLLSVSRKEILKSSPNVIHCHSWIATLIVCIAVLFLKNKPSVVYEVHGATAFESWYRHNKSPMRFISFTVIYFLENLAAILSDKLLLVSYEIKKYYPSYYLKPSFVISRELTNSNEILGSNITVNDSFLKFIGQARKNNMPVIVYSGGFSKWQMPKETVSLMNILSSKNLVKCVIFSNQVEEFKKIIVQSENWYIDSINSNELLSYLRLCDVGMLLREDIVLNRVASPTKLYEYIQAGLVVFTTKGAKEAKLACINHNYFEIDLDDFLNEKLNFDDVFLNLLDILKLKVYLPDSNRENPFNSCEVICDMYDI